MAISKRYATPTPLPTGRERKLLLRRLDVYHPGYPGSKPLLSFHASDNGGVDYTVVYYACCIVAGNVWAESEGRKLDRNEKDAFLSRSVQATPIAIPKDNILRAKRYFFHVPNYEDGPYPIVSNFNQWIFPATMPLPWRSLLQHDEDEDEDEDDDSDDESNGEETGDTNMDEDVGESSAQAKGKGQEENVAGGDVEDDDKEGEEAEVNNQHKPENPLSGDPSGPPAQDEPPAITVPNEPCRITGTRIGIDLAHIIPATCEKWFTANYMREYASTDAAHNDPLNDTPNLVPLDMKFHRFLDYSNITIVPKPNAPIRHKACESYSILTHVLRPPGKSTDANLEMVVSYHNLLCFPMPRVPIQYLFARFAWSFFNDTIMLIFNDKSANDAGFRLWLAQDGPDGNLKKVDRFCKKTFPKPRSGTRNKPGSKNVTSSMPPEEDDCDALSVDTSEPAFYDAFLEDMHSHHGSDIDPNELLVDEPRQQIRSPSCSGSDNHNDINDCRKFISSQPKEHISTDGESIADLSSMSSSLESMKNWKGHGDRNGRGVQRIGTKDTGNKVKKNFPRGMPVLGE